MATTITDNATLIREAMRLGGHPTETTAVNEALREYVRRRQQQNVVKLFGTIDFDPDYDYKRHR